MVLYVLHKVTDLCVKAEWPWDSVLSFIRNQDKISAPT